MLTTCATDYVTWRNALPRRRRGRQRRHGAAFSGDSRTRPRGVRPPVDACSQSTHSIRDELAWLDAEGPTSPALIDYIRAHEADVRLLHLLQLPLLPRVSRRPRGRSGKAILVPTAERDGALGLSIFRPVFRGVRALHVQLVRRARAHSGRRPTPTRARRGRRGRIGDSAARATPLGSGRSSTCGIDSRSTSAASTRTKAAPSCSTTSSATRALLAEGLHLVLIGTPIIPIPDHPQIHHLGLRRATRTSSMRSPRRSCW